MATVTGFEIQVKEIDGWKAIDVGYDTAVQALEHMKWYRSRPALANIQYRVVRTVLYPCKSCGEVKSYTGRDLCGSCYQDYLCSLKAQADEYGDDDQLYEESPPEYDPEAFLDEEVILGLR